MTRRRSRLSSVAVPVALVVMVMLAACDDGARPVARADGKIDGRITVLAASSLTEALGRIAEAFEERHRGVEVALSFDGSATLATQILEGAPADVFVSADDRNMATVAEAGRTAGESHVVASNGLAIVVAAGNPLGIGGLADLSRGRTLTVALCEAAVPCGAYADEAFSRAGLAAPPAAREKSVKGVLTKVQLGEADAGIVYVTDARGASDVSGIDIPADQQVRAAYPASVLADAPNPPAAAAFLSFLEGVEARRILADLGFGPP